MSTHNIGFNGAVWKIIPKLSPDTLLTCICSAGLTCLHNSKDRLSHDDALQLLILQLPMHTSSVALVMWLLEASPGFSYSACGLQRLWRGSVDA